jgi:hypothetical protein
VIKPCSIEPWSVWDDDVIREQLGVSGEEIALARGAGQLEYSQIGGKYFYLGKYIWEWIDVVSSRKKERSAKTLKKKPESAPLFGEEDDSCASGS